MAEEIAILAGGCFWGMEDLIRKLPGVIETQVGYTGGALKNANYKQVKTGTTGHAEAIRIRFDPAKTSYRKLLEFFFQIHDPTTKDRQGNDTGSQYRSAIFYLDAAQKAEAEKIIAEIDASKRWPGKVVTEVVAAGDWQDAEEYHQDYLEKYPEGYTCHFVRPKWKV
ncbi:MAG: peptide-methionine (S)-S-oxide reductase MsrA [Parvularculaceae bacterium]|nr:peptide-methionine (S)-S-oxide reductase MsrA [Parvularculaceae bacterium]